MDNQATVLPFMRLLIVSPGGDLIFKKNIHRRFGILKKLWRRVNISHDLFQPRGDWIVQNLKEIWNQEFSTLHVI